MLNLGTFLGAPQPGQTAMNPALLQAINPQAMAQQAQPGAGGGIGAMLAGLKENPLAIQMLLQSGAKLLNPTTFGSPGGRIADAVASGVTGYNQGKAATAQQEFENKATTRKLDQGDRQLDLTEKGQGNEMEQWADQFAMSQDELAAKKKLWDAQAKKYAADAQRLATKATSGEELTGPERIINNLAGIMAKNNVPADQAYVTAFDIYNKSGQDEAKAVSSIYESLGFLANDEEGKEVLENMVRGVQETFRSGSESLNQTIEQLGQPQGQSSAQPQGSAAATQPEPTELAPGVMTTDVEAALTAINADRATKQQPPITLEELNELQRDRLFQMIRERKGAAQ